MGTFRNKFANIAFLPLVLFAALPALAGSQPDTQFDFGHMGIDFRVKHTFRLPNDRPDTMRIIRVDPVCDCSYVIPHDTEVPPGDTADFTLVFSSNDYYGPASRHFNVMTDRLDQDTITYNYTAIIGQWFYGLKPDPISVFMLPGKNSQEIRIPNEALKRVEITGFIPFDTFLTVTLSQSVARRGEELRFTVAPAPGLSSGTFETGLTLQVKVEGADTEARFSIPVKIVRF